MDTVTTEAPIEIIIKCEVIELSDEEATEEGDDKAGTNDHSSGGTIKPKRKRIRKIIPLEKYVQCEHCSKRFATNSQLKKHILTHTGERPYVCSECGKAYRQLHTLRAHELTHSEGGAPKNFACDECGATFVRKTSLRVHARIHSGVKPYQCTVCDKSFTQKINLVSHIKVHQDDRQFECNECDKKFITRTKLNQHLKKHANKRDREKRKLESGHFSVIQKNLSKIVSKSVSKCVSKKVNVSEDFSASDEEASMMTSNSPLWSMEGDNDSVMS